LIQIISICDASSQPLDRPADIGTLFDHTSLSGPNDTRDMVSTVTYLYGILANLKPRFIRFPGGCLAEGEWLKLHFNGKKVMGHGRDLGILVICGCIGLRMDSPILSFFY
ncbi:hypothetical protein PIB30_086394, partial [Stylosanthes scabra]|nr:hypothetical protein [Stylosanthes scabra]